MKQVNQLIGRINQLSRLLSVNLFLPISSAQVKESPRRIDGGFRVILKPYENFR
jgi:hypothetical protein